MLGKENDKSVQQKQQWSVLEECYRLNKLVSARILEISLGNEATKSYAIVDVGGIRGYVENFVIAVTISIPAGVTIGTSKEDMQPYIHQKAASMIGQNILLGITEINPQASLLKLSQKVSPKITPEFLVGREYSGFVVSINPVAIMLELRGMRGILYSKQNLPDGSGILDLSTIFHHGQEIKVIITKKHDKHMAVVSLKKEALLSLIKG